MRRRNGRPLLAPRLPALMYFMIRYQAVTEIPLRSSSFISSSILIPKYGRPQHRTFLRGTCHTHRFLRFPYVSVF
jgi:hypothetical protein